MPFTVRLAQHGSNFIVEDDETILDAALRQNFDMPHSCCEGICGSCAGQVIDGVVRYDHPEQLIFDEAERAEGKALFCSARPESDLLIDAPGIDIPAHNATLKTHHYRLLSLDLIAADVYQAVLEPESTPLHYLAGQYIEISGLQTESPKFFSIANAPNAAHSIALHIRCQSNNTYAQKLIAHLKQHQSISLRGPLGNCFYHPKPQFPAIMIAVGTGFAPMKAILENMFATQPESDVTLFWAGKSSGDLYQLPLLSQWSETHRHFRAVPVLDCATPPADWHGAVGNVLDQVLAHYPDLAKHHIYFAGPMQLTLDALDRFLEHGAQICYMYSDAFDLM